MYCKNCSNQLTPEDKFCQNCGTAVQNIDEIQYQPMNENNLVNPIHKEFESLNMNNQYNVNHSNSNNFKKYLSFIIGGIILILAILFIINILSKNNSDKILYTDLTNDPQNIKTVISYNNTCKKTFFSYNDELYCYAQFNEYEEYVTLLSDICSIFCLDNLKKDKDGTIKDEVKRLYNLDMTNKDDNNYFVAMYYIFDDYKIAHDLFADSKSYLNKNEAIAKIKENQKRLQETWNRFLAHKDLDYELDIKSSDDHFIFDGKYKGKSLGVREYKPIYDYITDENGNEQKEVVEPLPKTLDEEEIVDVEVWARNYKAISPGSDGTYKSVIKEFANKFEIILDYNFNNIYDGCYGTTADDVSGVFAAYCHATPNKIFINDKYTGIGDLSIVNTITDTKFKETFNFPNIDIIFNMKDVRKLFTAYPYDLKSSIFLDVLKHEMAHHLIGSICGTAQPLIAYNNGVEIEAVTNSYAMIYLGASPYLEKFNPKQYWVNSKTDQIAKEIHDNHKCN